MENPFVAVTSAGAKFYKCALQVNPAHYSGTYRGQETVLDEKSYAKELVRKAADNGVNVLAVTDHNHVGGVDAIRIEAASRGIIVIPGFELVSKDGVHVLCLYPLEATQDELGRHLGGFGIKSTAPSSINSDSSFSDIVEQVAEDDGIAIAAHVTNNGGLLRMLSGETRIKAWKDQNLLAVQIPGAVDDLPQKFRSIVRNKDGSYRRDFAPEPDLAIAVVNARDVASPEDISCLAATCWIKMSEVGIEGLRQAFLDPGSRIRLNSESATVDHAEISMIAWQGGFLDGSATRLNPNLNVLVGGRGAGKSTVVESLRIVFGLEPLGDEARESSEGIRQNVLRNGTKISLLVKSTRPTTREYRIERTIPNPPIVRDGTSGDLLDIAPKDIFPGVEVYGQHEISELAKNAEKRTQLIRRFMVEDDKFGSWKDRLRRELDKSKVRIVETSEERLQAEESLAELPALEETLKRYESSGLEQDLKEQSQVVSEERKLSTVSERMEPFYEGLNVLRQELPIERTFLSEKLLKDLPGKAILQDADKILEKLSDKIEQHAMGLETSLDEASTEMRVIREQFESRKRQVQSDYEKKLRQLQKLSIDGDEFIKLRRKIESLGSIKKRLGDIERTNAGFKEHRRKLLAEWAEARRSEFKALERAGKRVTRKLSGRVRVSIDYAGNRESLLQTLQCAVGGRLAESKEALSKADHFSPEEFVKACRDGAEALIKKFRIPKSQATRIAQMSEEELMSIEVLEFPPTTKVELNIARENEDEVWRSLDQLSTGQKATAILLLLLLDSDSPLVIDQPEDDLDNRFITEGIVPLVRREKKMRQLIFSTHNANIPVLGDAELIVGLTASGEGESGNAKIFPKHVGSIDVAPVRELIGELLEGGEEAFERRRRKYGF